MTAICPRCNSEIDAERNVCAVCFFGEGLKADTVECTKCHSELDDDARFCPHCGAMALAETAVTGDPIRTALAAKLASQYRIVRLLGRGGMGSVYLARDLTLDREVAIKVVRTADESREIYDRFRREARTAAKLSHPNIVPLHAFGEVEGMPYFVMGYVRGESLADRLRRDGKLGEEEARRIFVEIADALDHAHRQGVVHRDVKPDNVLLEDESGRALLTDFGVARAVDTGEPLTLHGSVIGTPHYMSPEQASGRSDIDGRSDIYSLGVMAYAMLAGRLPFEGKTAGDILAKHLNQQPAPLRSVAPSVSDSTVQALERCLAKDPTARWPDARSLKLALGVVGESQLPDALHAAESRGVPALAIAYMLTLLYALLLGDHPEGPFVAVSTPALATLIYLFVVARLQRQGFSRRQSQSVIWREPAWWLWWYPGALRRRGNVWDRLPEAVRYLRWSVFVFVVYMIALESLFCFMGIDSGGEFLANPRRHPISFWIHMTFLAAAVLTGFLLAIRTRGVLKRKGLDAADVDRVILTIPPSRASFWARPHIAAILAPSMPREDEARPDSPHDQLQSIIRDANEMSGPLRPLGSESAMAGRQLLASIDHIDREIATLSRSLEPGEEERLADKIAGLSAESEPLRSLLEKQLDLIRDLASRVEEAKEKRNRHVELLKTLALHVASLRTRSPETPADIRMISDRVRALCDDIAGREPIDDSMATVRK